MKKPVVLILGASRYYVRSIQAAREAGCTAVVTDRDPNAAGFAYADHAETVDITDIPGTLAVAHRYRIDGIVAVSDFGVPTAAAVASELHLPGIPPIVAADATNKARMRAVWERAGVPSVRYRAVRTPHEAHRALRELETLPVIVKPADSRGGGSRGVTRVDRAEELEAAVALAQSFYEDPTVVIEEYVEGLEHSVETITYRGTTHILAVSDKVKTEPPYHVDLSVIYPTALAGNVLAGLHSAVRSAVRALGIEIGAAHVELATTPAGPRLFEVGARCGGGGTPDPIVPYVTGIEMFKEVVRIAIGREPGNLAPLHQRGCVYRFLAPAPGRLREVRGLDTIRTWPGVLDADLLVRSGDEIGPVRRGSDRAGFIIAGAPTRAEALALADRTERAVQFIMEPAGALRESS
jgi:biotin carboxylase